MYQTCIPGTGKIHQAERPDLPVQHGVKDHRSVDLRMFVFGASIFNEPSLHECSFFLCQEVVRLRPREVDNDKISSDRSNYRDRALDNEDPTPACVRAHARDLDKTESKDVSESRDRCRGSEKGGDSLLQFVTFVP